MMGKVLPRRTFLQGVGATVALPLLDAMAPAFASAKKLNKIAPCRLAFAYVPNGVILEQWTPEDEGSQFGIRPILEPLAPYRKDWQLISGLAHKNGRALGDGPGDHARAAASYLTGVHPKKTKGADIRNGISVDQVAAEALGGRTRFASLELGTEHGRQVGNCDSGYSCAYSNSLAWRSETTPLPPEVNPRLVFQRLFGSADGDQDPAARARQARHDRSILDFVGEDAKRLKIDLGPTDRRKLDEYLHAVREIEARIQRTEQNAGKDEDAGQVSITMERPGGIPLDYAEHVRLMFDLQVVAFQTDLTRITTFMLGREGSNRTYREIGVPDAHHGLTHHQGDEKKIADIAKINRYHMEQFAYFLDRLGSTPDGEGSLLDHSVVVYGSGLADGNRHSHHDLPVLVAGRGCGKFHPGRHRRYPKNTPMTNLYLTILDRVGVPAESLGDSTGPLKELSEI